MKKSGYDITTLTWEEGESIIRLWKNKLMF